LGCTHYSFLANQIAAIAGPTVTIVEPSTAIARQLTRVLLPEPTLVQDKVNTIFYTSGSLALMSAFLECIDEPFEQVHSLPICKADFK
jgi:glutamate racemase